MKHLLLPMMVTMFLSTKAQEVPVFDQPWRKAKVPVVFVFLSPECPLCQNYTRTLNTLTAQYGNRIHLYGIIPGKAYSAANLRSFKEKYNLQIPLYADPDFSITHDLAANVTPEAIVIDTAHQVAYKGAIDNWMVSLGQRRHTVTEHYLKDALEAVLSGRSVKTPHREAVGCAINEY